MMEWGILMNNDPYLYGQRLKYYLVIGARRSRTDIVYPDPSWGYGEVYLSSAIENIIKNIGIVTPRREDRNLNKNNQNRVENQPEASSLQGEVAYIVIFRQV